MFTVRARVVIRIKHSLQDVSYEDCHQFMVSLILPVFAAVFATVFTGFFHSPGKNSFYHGKNPTLRQYNDFSTQQILGVVPQVGGVGRV